jgi:flagellar hook-associated protein FlgK
MQVNSSIPSAIQSGLSGVQKAEQGVADSAVQISRLNTEQDRVARSDNQARASQPEVREQQRPEPSLEAEAVNLVVNEYLAKANTKVIKTADEMIGTLIDTKV